MSRLTEVTLHRCLQDVYNTHTHANYSHRYKPQQVGQPWRVPADRDSPIRLAQIAQLAQFIKLTVRCTQMAEVCGVSRPLGQCSACHTASLPPHSCAAACKSSAACGDSCMRCRQAR